MNIDLIPIGFSGGILFWIFFIILGLLMPFFVFINTIILGKVLKELKNINKDFDILKKEKTQQNLIHKSRTSYD